MEPVPMTNVIDVALSCVTATAALDCERARDQTGEQQTATDQEGRSDVNAGHSKRRRSRCRIESERVGCGCRTHAARRCDRDVDGADGRRRSHRSDACV